MDLYEFALTDLKRCRSEQEAKRNSLAVTKFFGIKAGFATLPYHLWQIWHPCNTDALPAWVQSMEVTHLALQTQPVQTRGVALLRDPAIEADLVSQVHALYHQLAAESDDDTRQCLSLIKLCNTVFVVAPMLHADGTTRLRKAIAALSFVRHGDHIHILYFGVAAEFREGGFGTLLLTLAGKCRPSSKVLRKQQLAVRLNTITRLDACLFFQARGFLACQNLQIAGQATPNSDLAIAVRRLCQEASVLQPFVASRNTTDPKVDAAWVWGYLSDFATMKIGAAAQAPFRLMQPEKCMLSYPATATEMLHDPACYCCLPSGLLIPSIEHCKHNLMLWQHDVFTVQQSGPPVEVTTFRGYAPTRVSWHERLALKPNQPLPCSIMQLVLECLTSTTRASIEQQYASFLPPNVIQHAMSALHLLRQYVIAAHMNEDNTASMPLDTTHVFHDAIDNVCFMEHLAVVIQFIVHTPSMFAKPFVVSVTQEIDGNWSCLIAINPKSLQSQVQQPQSNADVCGFQYFDPCADNSEFKAASIHPSNPTLFLLTIAKAMLCDDAAKKFPVLQNQTVPFNVTTLFANIQAFYAFYQNIEHIFGDRIDNNEPTWFHGNAQFVQLELPEAFPLRCNLENLRYQSGILCLLFLVDWCVTVSHRTFKWSKQNVKPHVRQEGLWRFPMPQAFKMGTFLKTTLSLKLRRNKKASQPPLFLPVDDFTMTLVLHAIVVLCDRVMHYNCISNSTAGVHHVLYGKHLSPPPEHVVDVAAPLYINDIMVDQASTNDWTPRLVEDCAEAANTLMQLGTAANSEKLDDDDKAEDNKDGTDDVERTPAAVMPQDATQFSVTSDDLEIEDDADEKADDAEDDTDDDERKPAAVMPQKAALPTTKIGDDEDNDSDGDDNKSDNDDTEDSEGSEDSNNDGNGDNEGDNDNRDNDDNEDSEGREDNEDSGDSNIDGNGDNEGDNDNRDNDDTEDSEGSEDNEDNEDNKDNEDSEDSDIDCSEDNEDNEDNEDIEDSEDSDIDGNGDNEGDNDNRGNDDNEDSEGSEDNKDSEDSDIDGNGDNEGDNDNKDNDEDSEDNANSEHMDNSKDNDDDNDDKNKRKNKNKNEEEDDNDDEMSKNVDSNNDEVSSDDSDIDNHIGFGNVPMLTSAQKLPRKRRSTAALSSSPPKSKLKNDNNAVPVLSVAMMDRIRSGMTNHSCCSNDACKRPGGTSILSAVTVHERKAQACHRCKLLAHYICMQWRARKLCCFSCADIVKREEAQKRLNPQQAPKRKNRSGVDIPTKLISPKMALRWEIQHRKWDMNRVIANEMAHLQYMTWTEMKALVTKQNRKNTIARRHWRHWSEDKREQHKKERNKVHAMRLEWVKTYRAFEEQFLKTTHSFIPDLRYDKKKKCYVGRAEWNDNVPSDHGGTETVTHEREVVLTNEFVETHFPRDVRTYVKEACRASDGKFFPVPKPVALALDTRVITHVKYKPAANDTEQPSFVVRYADLETEPIAVARLIELFGPKFVEIVKRYAKRGFINVPPGDVKPTGNAGSPPVCTAFYSNLPIRFPQRDNKTCVMSSFASALWAVGLSAVSMRVAQAVAASEDNPVVLAELASLMNQQHSWLQPVRIKKANQFNLLTHDLRKSFAVVVLKASDGSTTHAITVHDNAIFDSNEATSLMLCQENLDYLCSTATQSAQFTGIMAGYIYQEQGKRNQLECSKKSMPNDPWKCASIVSA